jgi:lipid II:glycine glycyltransferase (peptidoglycan interpeptide bridge formation enzyme)
LDYVKNIGKENNCFMLRFSPLTQEDSEISNFYKKYSLLKAPIHNLDALISQYVDLSKDLELLRRDMNKTKRNLLNRSLKDESVSVKIFNDDSQFDVFKEFHIQTTKLKGYKDRPVDMLIEELKEQISKNMFYILIGYYNGKPIGFWQCTVYGENMHLYQAGTDTEFRKKNINISYVLYWETLKLAKELGCEKLDLFGGVVPVGYENRKHPWRGVNDFKESLGGQKITYMHSRDYPLKKLTYYFYYVISTLRTRAKGYTTKW